MNSQTTCVCVLRTTFRLHDNPMLMHALHDGSCKTIVIPIDVARVGNPHDCIPVLNPKEGNITTPHFVTCHARTRHVWGYHQYVFLLHVIQTFIEDLKNTYPQFTIYVVKESLDAIINHLKTYTSCLYDHVDDDAWTTFDQRLKDIFPEQHIKCFRTHTLLNLSLIHI